LSLARKHYSRLDVQKEIIDFCRNRWAAAHYVDLKGDMIFRRYLHGKPLRISDAEDFSEIMTFNGYTLRSVYATANVYWKFKSIDEVYDLANIRRCSAVWDVDGELSKWRETLKVAKEIVAFLNDRGVEKSVFLKWSGNGCHIHVHEEAFSEDLLKKHHPLDLAYKMESETESLSEKLGDRDIIVLGSIKVRLLFFDSLGAKCSSVLVETPDVSILIDPGAAGLQPSFPLPREEKARLREEAFKRIRRYGASSDIVVITHYHYDHHVHPSRIEEMTCLFRDKILLVKDPNQWINKSQRSRAFKFLSEIYRISGGNKPFKDFMETSRFEMISDPFERHPKTVALWERSKGKKLKVYQAKKRWFEKIVENWKRNKWVKSFEVGGTKILFADDREFIFGDTRIKFTFPLFHGQFLDNVGWVIGLTVEHAGNRFLFSSDLQGPIIEEYAEWIINSKPNVIVADGPPLYHM